MKYIFHFTDKSHTNYESVFNPIELMTFLQQSQVLKLKNILSNQEELVNLKYVIRIEKFVEIPAEIRDDLPY
jgi:hypothetical protein